MADTTFVDGVTVTAADWFNDLNRLHYTLLGDPTTVAAVRTALAVATNSEVATLTNKTINLSSNTLVATSAQLAAAVTDETGTGSLVFSTSPVLASPALGTPSSGTLTNCTGLPVAGGGTGAATFASGGLLVGNGTSALGIASAGQIVAAIGTTNVTNATNVTGTTTAAVPTAALASGTANSTTVLHGDRTFKLPATDISYSCSLTPAVAGTLTSTAAAIAFATEQWDDFGWHDNVTNNSRITVGVSGRYLVIGHLAHVGAAVDIMAAIYKNGVATHAVAISDGGGPNPHAAVVCLGYFQLAATDYIELFGWASSNATIATASTSLQIQRVG